MLYQHVVLSSRLSITAVQNLECPAVAQLQNVMLPASPVSNVLAMQSLNGFVIFTMANGSSRQHVQTEYCLHVSSFIYTDWVIMECLRNTKLKNVAFSYDIWCRFQTNMAKRIMECFPPDEASAFFNLKRRGFIPKLHLYAHGSSCATVWSLNYHHGVGRTDGESTERDWASAVLAALQTSEMNPGSRHAVLDDHWIDKNFQRVLNFSLSHVLDYHM
jgi:hypothetical protein